MRPDEPDPHRYREIAPQPPEGPLDLASLLPGGPVELEIGYGRGLFLLERAAAAPEQRVFGVEIKRKWAYLVAQRAERLELTNLRAWAGDARDVLARAGEASIARVFMNFPDPWWKKRHAKRRLTGETLLDDVARVLSPGGEFFVQTDVQERAEIHLGALAEHPAFDLGGQDGWLSSNPYQARSNREVRAEQDGLPIYRTLAIRRGLAGC